MAISASDQIVINNIPVGLQCVISINTGSSLVDVSEPPVLTCKIYDETGELDTEIPFNYTYKWEIIKTADISRNFTGKQLEINSNDFEIGNNNGVITKLNSIKVNCKVYLRYDEQDDSQNILSGYAEITLDSTVKKWMEFDDSEGLKIHETGSDIYTLTSNEGFFVKKKEENNTTTLGAFCGDNNYLTSVTIGKFEMAMDEESGGLIIRTTKGLMFNDYDRYNLDTLYKNALAQIYGLNNINLDVDTSGSSSEGSIEIEDIE